jgi:hypothetical protein
MIGDVDFRIGPSRSAPGRISQRLTIAGQLVPRPSNIQHRWRQPSGRSSGGAAILSDLEGMEWTYSQGADRLYIQLCSVYNPVVPWVWVHMLDPRHQEGIWLEAVVQEPSVVRGVGKTIQTLSVVFHSVVRV